LATQLQACVAALEAKQSDNVIGECETRFFDQRLTIVSDQSSGHEVWQAILDMIKNVSEVLLSYLPNFWRIAKGFQDGKFKKVTPVFFYSFVYPYGLTLQFRSR
jgi:exocyst complex component 2